VTFVSSQGKAPREERVTKSKSQFGSELTFLSAKGHAKGGRQRPRWDRRKAGFQVWLELAWLGGLCVVAAYISQKCGLLALACEAQGRTSLSPAGRWLRLLAHFKLSVAVLLASMAVSWWARYGLVRWLVAPAFWRWVMEVSGASQGPLFYAQPQPSPWLLITFSVAWLPVVPFLASDVWRLLRPLMAPRAAKLHLAFAIASVVLVLGAVLLIRHHAISLFGMFGPPTGATL
jgi:hypothetical protein